MSFETIWVKFKADLSDYNRKVADMNKTLLQSGQQMKTVGRNMSASLTAPIALFGITTLKAAGDFQSGMNRVQALTQATQAEFKMLEKQAKELGATTQFSASQAADAMGFLAMAGLNANKIYGAMPHTLNLAAAAQIDMASAADIVTNVLTGMQLPMERLPEAVDILSKAFTTSNTDLMQLGQAMKFVGPVSTSFNQSIEGTTAALGLLGNAGIQAGMAGRGYRQLLVQLVKKQKEMGISVLDSSGKMLPMVDILKRLEKSGYNSTQAMTDFSAQAGTVLSTLLLQGSGELEKFTVALNDAGGTAKRIADVQMQGLNGAIKELKSTFEAFQLALADSGVLEWVTGFAKGMAEWFREMSKTNPALLRMAAAVAAVLAVAGPLALVAGTLVTALGSMLAPVSLALAGLGGLAALMAANALETKTHTGALEQEREELNTLVDAITSTNVSEANRRDLLNELQQKYPSFLGNLSTEKVTNDQLKTALEAVNKQYEQKIINALKEEEISALLKRKVDLHKDELKTLLEIAKANKETDPQVRASQLSILNTALDSTRALQEALNKEIEKTNANYANLVTPTQTTPSSGGGTGGAAVKAAQDEATKILDIKKNAIYGEIVIRSEYEKWKEGIMEQGLKNLENNLREQERKTQEAYDRELEAFREKERRKQAIFQESFQAAHNLLGTLANIIQTNMNKELAAAGDNEAKKDQIKRKYAKKQQRVAIGEAIINGAQGATRTYAQLGFPLAIPFIAAGAALVASQIGLIKSQAFAKGGIVSGPVNALVGDNPNASHDPEVISPLSKLKDLIGGGRMQTVRVVGEISGETIYLSMKEYERKTFNTRG